MTPSPLGGGRSPAPTPTKTSGKCSVTPYGSDFREALSYCNTYISCNRPPIGVMQRANEIISVSRSSPEVCEATAWEIRDKSREPELGEEQDIIQQLAPFVIPAMGGVPDQKLLSKASSQWTSFVPVLLDPLFEKELPLSKPRPDKVFGYSKKAFTKNQLGTALLLKDPLGWGYATLGNGLLLPFFNIKFKSQAKGGSHVIALNQAANAGAIVGHGLVELTRRSVGLENLDHDEPQLFSISMDHTTVHVNMHWLSADTQDGQLNFQVETLSTHDLRRLDDLRAVQRTVKSIFDWGQGEWLQMICRQLDGYVEKVEVERTAAERATAAASGIALVDTGLSKRRKGRKPSPPGTQNQPTTKQAPLPPKPLQSARALYDFIIKPEDDQSDLKFKKDDIIEFANEKTNDMGWLRRHIKGGDGRWGNVLAGYLEL
ncbi:MAG: hypothetical protein M1839_006754 [Geoglossum umbratile]|nr:MAG: hypothetical protein M1839_006754 [Geoglossum umbratile]